MADDKSSLLGTSRPAPPQASAPGGVAADAVYHDSSQSPNARLIQVLYVALVVVMVVITMSLSIFRCFDVEANGGTYLMLGICLLGFVFVEVLLIIFTRRGDLPKGKTWFLYFVGFCIILEAIFTDILLFQ